MKPAEKQQASTEDETVKITVRMPKPLSNRLKHRAIDESTSVQDLVIRALEAYLGRKAGRHE